MKHDICSNWLLVAWLHDSFLYWSVAAYTDEQHNECREYNDENIEVPRRSIPPIGYASRWHVSATLNEVKEGNAVYLADVCHLIYCIS